MIARVKLRPHQQSAVTALLNSSLRIRHAELAVATGKSLIAAEICRRAVASGHKVLMMVPNCELLDQNRDALDALGVSYDTFSASREKRLTGRPVTVGTPQTVVKNLDRFSDVTLILIDESHGIPHENDAAYRQIIDALPNAGMCGLTGTAFRASGSRIDPLFGPCVFKYDFKAALRDGWVKPLHAAPTERALEIDGTGEDNDTAASDRGVQLSPIHADKIRHFMAERARNCAIAICCSIAHAEALAAALRACGVTAVSCHSKVSKGVRAERVAEFREGRVKVMTSVLAFAVGFNVPSVDLIVLARPIKSAVLYAQGLGRGARPTPAAKECLVLDFGGNIARLGPLDLLAPDLDLKGAGAPRTPSISTPGVLGRQLTENSSAGDVVSGDNDLTTYVRLDAAATVLGTSVATLRRKIRTGLLRSFVARRRTYVSQADVLEILKTTAR